MQAVNVTTSQTLIAPEGNRDFIHIQNWSDTILYLKYDGDSTTLTTSNGIPLLPQATLQLNNDGKNIFRKAVYGIHGGSGNKEVRVQGV